MALYLGNQKVSLKSGQDPTFDYGFDSNGRLVFANKNATEINNFLNYDSTYSEILDLSNLNKMEKVAVNGTADRKMEGLKGLLVSPNAPFTGSSPQINASYTGLSRAALVNLFKSMPYNVGYEVVGSPTISNGVVSGFGASNYLYSNQSLLKDCTQIEIATKIKVATGDLTRQHSYISFANTSVANNECFMGIANGGKPWCTLRGGNNTVYDLRDLSGSVVLQNNDTAFLKLSLAGNTAAFSYSADGITWSVLRSVDVSADSVTFLKNIPIRFGTSISSFNYYANGSIDLNETYIKVNGVPWFGPGATKNLVPGGTVVGDVIVKDGVASGFTADDYLSLGNAEISGADLTAYETTIKFKPNANASGSMIGRLGALFGFYTNKGSLHAIFVDIRTKDTVNQTWKYKDVNVISSLDSTKNYIATLHSDTASCYFKYSIDDGATWTTTQLDASGASPSAYFSLSIIKIGSGSWFGGFGGSIDLNNTYIKVGSDYFYRGMVPMTKTCSIVGATGTSDLTQEDKNIILNKGWSLTVK